MEVVEMDLQTQKNTAPSVISRTNLLSWEISDATEPQIAINQVEAAYIQRELLKLTETNNISGALNFVLENAGLINETFGPGKAGELHEILIQPE